MLYSEQNNKFVFQYILCYCLSNNPLANNALQMSFNTSYVTVYQMLVIKYLLKIHSFNTSHVIVYPTHFRHFFFYPITLPLILQGFFHFLPAETLLSLIPLLSSIFKEYMYFFIFRLVISFYMCHVF